MKANRSILTCPYSNCSHVAVWKRGREARLAGEPRESCPYTMVFTKRRWPKPKIPPGSNGYHRAWVLGWESVDKADNRSI